MAARDEKRPQIVDSMRVIRMFMRENHRIEVLHARIDQLLAQIRRGIDQNAGIASRSGFLDEDRAAATPVAGLGGVAFAPALRHARHTAG